MVKPGVSAPQLEQQKADVCASLAVQVCVLKSVCCDLDSCLDWTCIGELCSCTGGFCDFETVAKDKLCSRQAGSCRLLLGQQLPEVL